MYMCVVEKYYIILLFYYFNIIILENTILLLWKKDMRERKSIFFYSLVLCGWNIFLFIKTFVRLHNLLLVFMLAWYGTVAFVSYGYKSRPIPTIPSDSRISARPCNDISSMHYGCTCNLGGPPDNAKRESKEVDRGRDR